jgi:hypothetical protein
MEKSLKIRKSKSLKWLILLVTLGLTITFSSCNKDSNCTAPEDNYPSLKITNDLKDYWRAITTVSLVGYHFNDLDIEPLGDSQLFLLDKGMPGGYENINVTVYYRSYPGTISSRSLKVNFVDGETTSLTLTGCDGAEGCPGISLVQDD